MSKLTGIEDLKKQLEALDKRLRNKVITKALRDGGKVMAKAVKDRAPVASGFLKKNIKVRSGKRKKDKISFRVVIGRGGDNREYIAAFSEYGTHRQAPKPFIRPAFQATKDQVTASALGDIKRAIEGFAGPKRTAEKSGLIHD